ncbi:hypothetical protein [Aquimarina muelleri]|uniref:Uncharacterized protein n=2 Tax=Aquimarina muelleri TaxID=279356 RepID=A0A918JZ31_9FLAO|nr:hypothetical protein [Aquimarina muelleri]MCX2765086.1 hypothetical protein [Aquimarina muelleri]GGX36344.1 hypothetical protein GCM10007384_39800 [Aquimarina muelleri]
MDIKKSDQHTKGILMTTGKLLLLLISLTFFNCSKMNTNFTVEGPKEVLEKIHVNIDYTDYQEKWHSFTTYYKGKTYRNNAEEILAYGVNINYNDILFFEELCDFNPHYFDYADYKKIIFKKEKNDIYVKVLFFEDQANNPDKVGFTKLLTLDDFFKKNNIIEDSIKHNYEKSFKEVIIP